MSSRVSQSSTKGHFGQDSTMLLLTAGEASGFWSSMMVDESLLLTSRSFMARGSRLVVLLRYFERMILLTTLNLDSKHGLCMIEVEDWCSSKAECAVG